MFRQPSVDGVGWNWGCCWMGGFWILRILPPVERCSFAERGLTQASFAAAYLNPI